MDINKTIQFTKITDIIHKMDEYLQVMREMKHDDMVRVMDILENNIKEYFLDESIAELQLKKDAVEMVDALYLKLMELEMKDVYTDRYFGIIISLIFQEFANKKIYIFFIIDNRMRDDRFKLLIEIFATIHFEVVYPYKIDKIDYSQNYTCYTTKDFSEIESQIDEAKKQKKHILYIEKDDSINYLTNILQIGEEFQNEYTCLFRNKDIKQKATWLLGSFSDVLNT